MKLIEAPPLQASFLEELRQGLGKPQKELPAKYFYDDRGSVLFERITALDEYYLTRTEIGILTTHAEEIADQLGRDVTLIELGSGNSSKARILLDRLQGTVSYVPVDLSKDSLRLAAAQVASSYPEIRVTAICADYTQAVDLLPRDSIGPVVIFFPGSTIGNLIPHEVTDFLRRLADSLRAGDRMLIGVDLKKDPAILHAAYNDSAGVTAEFNLNVLQRINRELAGDFDVSSFEPLAFYNEREGRIEMHLRSLKDQRVTVLGETFTFRRGETIHTENSYKYTVAEFHRLLQGTSFRPGMVWTDQNEYFSLHELRVIA